MKLTVRSSIAFLLFFLYSVDVLSEEKVDKFITFGIVPQQSASKLARLWTPILNKLSKETGLKIKFKTAPNIPTFEQRLLEGEYDIAYMNPYHYTVFSKVPGYVAFAKAKDKLIKGIIVIRKDNKIQTLEQLSGKTLAFPAPAAFAASILPRAHFSKNNIPVNAKYVSSHDSVYRTVAKGLFPAGGGVLRTFNNVSPDIKKQLRIFWTTKGYTPHAFAAHPEMNTEIINKIAAAMYDLNETEEGMALLETINLKGFIKAYDEDWNDVRALDINLLNN
jgi:phosphonate transport system substrate-binding protein